MKKIFTITESERKSILSKHESYKKSLINEQSAVTSAATTTAAVRTKDCSTTKNPARCKQKVLDVQVKINDKCTKISQKLVEDGIYGTNTANAIKACTGMDFTQSSTTQQTAPGGPIGSGTSNPVATTTGGPAGTQNNSSSEQFDSLTV